MRKLWFAGSVLLMAGCFNYTSITKIEPDGAGNLAIEAEVPYSRDVEITIEEFTPAHDFGEGWKTTSVSVDTLDTIIVYRLEGNFDSLNVVANILGFGSLNFNKEDNGSLNRFHLSRNYASIEESSGELRGTAYIKSTKALLRTFSKYDPDAFKWCEKIVVPGRIVEHNATRQKGDTLIWDRRTLDVFDKGLVMDMVWEVLK